MSRIIRLALIITILLSSIAATPGPAKSNPASSSRPSTKSILKRLGGRPCPDGSIFTCVTLTLPLDHFNPKDSRTIQVTFAVLPASNNSVRKGMFVTATGGPGTSGIAAADSYTAMFDTGITKSFDVVFFDQRGVALSRGLTCPNAAVTYYQADIRTSVPGWEAAVI
jgi:hypothetical protein